MRITELTQEQIDSFPKYVEEWTAYGLDTNPADRSRAEKGIIAAYKQAEFDAPRIVWCDSPRECIDVAHKESGLSKEKIRGAACYGQQEAWWLSSLDFYRKNGLADIVEPALPLMEICKSAGWFFPFDTTCYVSERPELILFDDRKLLHCESGPAIRYRDGFSIYSWHGVRIPKEWIEDKSSITPRVALYHDNVEQRRAACEILGWANILKELGGTTIDKHADPQVGELVEVEIPDIGRERFLRVMCGTGREFALPVPPDMQTAEQCQRWLNFIPDDMPFIPVIRT